MTEYTYLDIFATKGIEYMVVLVYFVLFVIFTRTLEKPRTHDKNSARKD